MKKKIILYIFILIVSFSLSASSKFDAEYLKKSVLYKLNADGSSMMEYHSIVKLHSYRATNRLFGESFIKYNPDFQKLEILISETKMKDGKKVKSPKNAYNEVLPYRAKKFPNFAGLKEMVVTHVGIERGAIIEFKYRLYTKPGFNTYFSGLEYLSDQFPVNELNIKVIFPKEKKINFYLNKHNKLLKKNTDGDFVEYSLALKSISQFNKEPISEMSRGCFIFTEAKNWAKIFPDRYTKEDIPISLLKPFKKTTSSDMEKLFKVQKLIVSDFDHCKLEQKIIGNRVRKIKKVYNSNYATSLEKAYLLSGVLNSAGIKNELMFLITKDVFNKDIPTLLAVKNYYIKITDKCKTPVFLDPVHLQNGPIPKSIYGQSLYNLDTGKFETIKKSDYSKNKISISGDIKLKGEKYNGKLLIMISGNYYNYRASATGKKYIKKSLSKFFNVSKITALKILNLSVNSIKAEIELEGKFLKQLNKGYFVLKGFNYSPVLKKNSYLKKRISPIVLNSAHGIEINLNIKYDNNMTIDFMAKKEQIENEFGVFINSVKEVSKGKINIKYYRGIKKSVIEADKYIYIKDILDKSNREQSLIIFKKQE